MSSNVTFLGMGLMGLPMATRLVDAGYNVVAWNRTFSKVRPLIAKGAFTADTLKAAIEASAIVLVMVSNADAVESIIRGGVESKHGSTSPLTHTASLSSLSASASASSSSSSPAAAAAAASGAASFPPSSSRAGASSVNWKNRTLINLSTIGVQQSVHFAAELSDAGGMYLECPVMGSVPHATAGKLTVLCGCDNADHFEKHKALLAVFGQPRHTGHYGTASTLKLALNQLIAAETAALAFSIGFVERSGISGDVLMDVLRGLPAHCAYYDFKYKAMHERNYNPVNFSTELMLKDVRLMVDEGERKGLNTSAVKGVASLLATTAELGFAEHDFGSIYQAVSPSSRSPHSSTQPALAPAGVASASPSLMATLASAPAMAMAGSSSSSSPGLHASARVDRASSAFALSSHPEAAEAMLILPGQRTPPMQSASALAAAIIAQHQQYTQQQQQAQPSPGYTAVTHHTPPAPLNLALASSPRSFIGGGGVISTSSTSSLLLSSANATPFGGVPLSLDTPSPLSSVSTPSTTHSPTLEASSYQRPTHSMDRRARGGSRDVVAAVSHQRQPSGGKAVAAAVGIGRSPPATHALSADLNLDE